MSPPPDGRVIRTWIASAISIGYPIYGYVQHAGFDRTLLFATIAVLVAGGLAALIARPSAEGTSTFLGGVMVFAFSLASDVVSSTYLIGVAAAMLVTMVQAPSNQRVAIFFSMLVVAGVANFSGAGGGPDPLREWLQTTFRLSATDTETTVIAIRKTVHFTAYGVYGLSWRRYGWWMVIAQTVTLASFDEARQTTVGTRTGSPTDVLLDLSGAIVLMAISQVWSQRRKNVRRRT
jgi:VanZ family protein